MSSVTERPGSRLRLRVTAAAESILRSGHPWLFGDSVREQNRPGELGELAVIYDRRDRFLAAGLFDPESPIRVRVLQAGKPQAIDDDWWRAQVKKALARRQGLFDHQTTGYRCIHGESDGWPGLVLDRYHCTLVLKLYTAVWLPRLQETVRIILEGSDAGRLEVDKRESAEGPIERIVLRLSRNIQDIAQKRFAAADGSVVWGAPLTGAVIFHETGLRFEAEVARGQKTGFFLDQRENRRQVETLASGREVLNAFSFSGGFSLYAARGGARAVTDLDLSTHALTGAGRNFTLNQDQPRIKTCRQESVQADAFEWLAGNRERKFDLVILDPPSLAKRAAERTGALAAYGRLAASGFQHLKPGGILVACSCSAHVKADEFFANVRRSAVQTKQSVEELATTGHPADHPALFPEAQYLKAIYLRTASQPPRPGR